MVQKVANWLRKGLVNNMLGLRRGIALPAFCESRRKLFKIMYMARNIFMLHEQL